MENTSPSDFQTLSALTGRFSLFPQFRIHLLPGPGQNVHLLLRPLNARSRTPIRFVFSWMHLFPARCHGGRRPAPDFT